MYNVRVTARVLNTVHVQLGMCSRKWEWNWKWTWLWNAIEYNRPYWAVYVYRTSYSDLKDNLVMVR